MGNEQKVNWTKKYKMVKYEKKFSFPCKSKKMSI